MVEKLVRAKFGRLEGVHTGLKTNLVHVVFEDDHGDEEAVLVEEQDVCAPFLATFGNLDQSFNNSVCVQCKQFGLDLTLILVMKNHQ